MASSYFKVRRRFDFSPHPFEIGIPLLHRQAYVDNYLFLKLYALDEADYGPFYAYHLHHFLTHHDQPEEVFFEHIWELVEDRIHYLKRQNPFSTQHGAHRAWIRSLQAFQRFLRTVDRWQKRQPGTKSAMEATCPGMVGSLVLRTELNCGMEASSPLV